MPSSPSMKQMPELAATTPSRPFVAGVVDMKPQDALGSGEGEPRLQGAASLREQPSFISENSWESQWKSRHKHHAGQIDNAVLLKICSFAGALKGRSRKSSRFC